MAQIAHKASSAFSALLAAVQLQQGSAASGSGGSDSVLEAFARELLAMSATPSCSQNCFLLCLLCARQLLGTVRI